MHASCAGAEINGRRSTLHPTHSILPYMCCAGPGSRGTSRIECFLVKQKTKKTKKHTRDEDRKIKDLVLLCILSSLHQNSVHLVVYVSSPSLHFVSAFAL